LGKALRCDGAWPLAQTLHPQKDHQMGKQNPVVPSPNALAPKAPAHVTPDELFDRAWVASNELAAAADELNLKIVEAEKFLANYKLGVSAQVLLWPGDGEAWDAVKFGKMQNQWRLMYTAGIANDELDCSLLVNASREIRIVAVSKLDELLEMMITQAEMQVKITTTACSNIDAFIAKHHKAAEI
jgi:hypothetical protein